MARRRQRQKGQRQDGQRSGAGPAAVMAGAVFLLALPSAVLAFSNRLETPPPGFAANQGLSGFAPGRVDPRLARALAAHPGEKNSLFRFTPAGLATRPDRSVTVAVRVDPETARTIIVRGVPTPARPSPVVPALRIAPAAYSLGLARGYQGFGTGLGQPAQGLIIPVDPHRPEIIPDLTTLSNANDAQRAAQANARLAPRISLDERDRAGRAPRTLEGTGEQTLDLGGSYRLTRNLDVTAGVRYSQDRDRLKPMTDGKADSQAVFVGTQFKF